MTANSRPTGICFVTRPQSIVFKIKDKFISHILHQKVEDYLFLQHFSELCNILSLPSFTTNKGEACTTFSKILARSLSAGRFAKLYSHRLKSLAFVVTVPSLLFRHYVYVRYRSQYNLTTRLHCYFDRCLIFVPSFYNKY